MLINKLLIWTPRILSILLIMLMFMFSFDVFDATEEWYLILLAFLIHNIPVLILTISLIFSFKRPMIGAIVFTSLGIFFTVYMLIENGFEIILTILVFGLPAMIIGALFGLTSKTHLLKH